MKRLVLLMVLVTTSCATHTPREQVVLCGAGTNVAWEHAASPPENAAALSTMTMSSPNFPVGPLTYPVEQWFVSAAGTYMLCRQDRSSCSGEWWQFNTIGDRPEIVAQDGWVCVTGLGPNNSSKPMPLRGTA